MPLLCDIRDDAQVTAAVAATVAAFGGIDICVNNASAIQLTGTLATDMKRFDLMHQINTRGTFLVSQDGIPHLKQAANPHILNVGAAARHGGEMVQEPRRLLDGQVRHVDVHARHGAEFAADGMAVNSLWPLTAIDTAAVRNLLGGEAVAARAARRRSSPTPRIAILDPPGTRGHRQFLHRRAGAPGRRGA